MLLSSPHSSLVAACAPADVKQLNKPEDQCTNLQMTNKRSSGDVQVADAIKAYGLTLANYASVREQTIGGFTQVGAHGTGVHLSTVDDQVIAMRLVTPSKGTITLSKVRCQSVLL